MVWNHSERGRTFSLRNRIRALCEFNKPAFKFLPVGPSKREKSVSIVRNFHVITRLIMSGVLPPGRQIYSWCGPWIKDTFWEDGETCILQRPSVTQRVGRGIALLFHDRGTRRRWVVSSTPRPYFIPGKDPVPILHEAGWATGPVWTGGKSRPHRNSIPDRPARSSVAIPTELPGHILKIIPLLTKDQVKSFHVLEMH